jgi:TM2 domain-containing membrane protein YozV
MIWVLCLGGIAKAQLHSTFTRDVLFARYLHDKEMYAQAHWVLMQIPEEHLQLQQKDSLFYWRGWNAYASKSLKVAAANLMQVSDSADWAQKSHFFGAYCMAYERDTAAFQAVAKIRLKDSIEQELQYFQMAGIRLLQRDMNAYDSLHKHFSFSSYVLENEERKLDAYYNKILHRKRKSAFWAGLYSAVIPGAGKIYAGKKGQGIGAFLPVALLAGITIEAYNVGGVKSARFITYGTLFSLFYAANIWGSVVAVKIKQREQNNYYDNQILLNMHIPLRNLYN